MTAALFAGQPMTCLERIEAMFAEYIAAAWVLGVTLGSLLT